MTKNKLNLTGLSEDELDGQLTVLENELHKLHFEKGIRGTTDHSEFKKKRRDIARILTESTKRELATFTPEDLEMRSRIRARRARNKKK